MKALTKITLFFGLIAISSQIVAQDSPKVRLQTSMGDIILELNQEKAPISVENFLKYVNEGFYNDTVFHRVMDGFMVQGGGFGQDLQRKPTNAAIKNEANNGLKNLKGTVAMARTNAPHSATAQFFINVVTNPFLDFRSETSNGWGYAVFANVVEGMDVVDKMRKTPTHREGQHQNMPNTPIVIQSASMVMPAAPAIAN